MNNLEHTIFLINAAHEHGAIGDTEAFRLFQQATAYVYEYHTTPYTHPDPGGPRDADERLAPLHDELFARFTHVLYPNGIGEGEDQ